MTALDLRRVGLQTRIMLAKVGVIIPLAFMVFVAGTGLWVWVALHALGRQHETELLHAKQQLRTASMQIVANRGNAADQNLHAFYDHLGGRMEAEQYVAALFNLAKQEDLQLDQGEYRWQVDNNSQTYRYQILFPVKAPYAAIRHYCEKVLAAMPFASLDELSFKRESIGEEALDASIRFSLFLKDPPARPQLEPKSK